MPDKHYIQDPCHQVFVRKGFPGLNYSDGDAVETRILDIVTSCNDRSHGSRELLQHVSDWATEYHFSPLRANILRPFGVGPSVSVLELGCGCGALTRYLGESGATVTALEGSLARARITAERCRGLSNVTVVCDAIDGFVSEQRFDLVTLIGVLEYAPQFIEDENPIMRCLNAARDLLAPNGKLVIAIENQLGLKYFNGCTEDHTGQHFFGIQDQYGTGATVTFGRAELDRIIKAAGLGTPCFNFPFPDYKLPDLILSEAAIKDPELDLPSLLSRSRDRDYAGRQTRLFAEHLAWRPIARNGLVGELANSFLVTVGHKDCPDAWTPDWLVRGYASNRSLSAATETTIARSPTGVLMVSKALLQPGKTAMYPVGNFTLVHTIPKAEPYLAGELLLHRMQRFAQQGDLVGFSAQVNAWIKHLLGTAAPSHGLRDTTISGTLIDCIPANLIVGHDTALHFIDREWSIRENIPFSWVLLRGLVQVIHHCLFPENFARRSCRSLIDEILSMSGISFHDTLIAEIEVLETALQKACHLPPEQPVLRRALDAPVPRRLPVDALLRIDDTDDRLNTFENEVARIKNSISWRITAPLRVVWNMLRRLAGKSSPGLP